MIDIRDNWRIGLLVVLCVLAALALFGPLGASGGGADFLDSNGTVGETIDTATTDESGEYSVELPEGEYQVTVDKVGYEPFTGNVSVISNDTATLDITLNASDTGAVEGTVTQNGTGVSDIGIEFRSNQTGIATATSDESGEYALDLSPGEYSVVVDETGYERFETTVSVESGTSTTEAIALNATETGTVAGTVTSNNETVDGLTVAFVNGNRTTGTVTTDENGTYEITLNAGTYDVRVNDVGYEQFETNVTVTANDTVTTPINLTAGATGTVTGTVTDGDEPRPGLTVEFLDLGTQSVVTTARTDTSGTYSIRLPANEYDVRVDGAVFETFTTTVTVVEGESQTLDIELTQLETGTVTGTVTDESGESLSDVDIAFRENDQFEQTIEEGVPDPTNLQYGLELSGGARIRGQFVGLTAEGVELPQGEATSIQRDVASELGLDPIDVRVRTGLDAVEVFSGNVTQSELASALQTAGLDVSEDDIRNGVTSTTRDGAVDTLTQRVDQTGLSGADVFTSSAVTGENFVVAEVPGISLSQLREVITDPGRVQIVAGFPDNGTLNTTQVLTTQDFAGIQNAQPANEQSPTPRVPVTLTDEAAQRYATIMQEGGFTNEGIGNCRFDETQHDGPLEGQHCLYTVVDGEYVYGASMSPDLAQSINNGDFVNQPRFLMQTGTFDQAQQLEVNLRSGELPTEIEVVSESSISPSLAQKFKPLALLTALVAWLSVCIVVYYWYRDVRVAVPMLLTAASEVFLLLGFAAAVGLALDLSHIAGLIAVIGTGLDDLIIVADEILQRKEDVKTGRIFQNRFRKAFWIIGMAAATTIIAMSPLAVLSLGDLQGFAIVTIVGVLIGIAVTRPAYGDVLRHMMLDDVKRK
jgi:preprotein translocase subunit SecD